jgi:hypothetical protein
VKIIVLIFYFYSFTSFALPKKPLNPESMDAYDQIASYYNIDKGLPFYFVKHITDDIKDNFIYRNVTLTVESPLLKSKNEIHFVLKIPLNSKQPNFPVIAMFTGLQTGEDSINLIENSGENILLGFQYPMPMSNENFNWDWTALESIPLQMTITLHWLQQQSYVDTKRINILSVSFGSIFTPLALRWLKIFNINIRTTTLGYGGGDIPLIVGTELRKKFGKNETEILKILIDHQTWFYDPKYHVANISGIFLIIHGQDDTVFPQDSIAIFDEKINAQKKIIFLPGSHIQPDRKDLINTFVDTVKAFLKEQDAIN